MKVSVLLLPIVALAIGLLVIVNKANAQAYQPSNRIPVADGTLGTQFTRSNNNFIIEGGVSRGQQLFHSFQDFSVPTGGAATFIRPAGNRSIITRVTGNLFSDINGVVDTQAANFLLINPNGVVFGPGTQLNVGPSFTASTASGVDLVDGSGRTITFGTNANGDAPFLAIDPNVFFNISRLNISGGRGEIRNFGTLQTVNPNQYIGLIGENVSIDGGQINAPGGRVELKGLSNVSLTNQARISVAGSGGGDIAINAQKITLLGGSVVRGGLEEGQGNPAAIGGDIKINGTGAVVIDGGSTIANNVRLNASGNGGNTTIDAGSLSVRNGSLIQSSTGGRGHAGNIALTAQDAINLDGVRILSLVTAEGIGNSGSLSVTANSLSITNDSLLTSSILGQGNAGNITLTAKDAIFLNNAGVFNSVEAGGIGKSGNLSVTTNSLSLADRSSLLSSTFGAGDSGNVIVTANSLSLTGGSTLASSTFGQGNAGNVTLTATDTVALNASNVLSSVGTGAVGNGGNIHLQARSLSLLDSTLIASSLGEGNAGNVVVTTQDSLLLKGRSSITSSIGTMGVGAGGNIDINTRLLSLQDGASLTSATDGQGNAGGINIKAITISLANDAFISANTFRRGNAGNIQVVAQDAITLVNASISNSIGAEGIGKGGDILINAGSLSLQNGSFLSSATNGQGNAGNIDLTVNRAINIFGTQDSRKSGISSAIGPGAQGNGGNITVNPGTLALRDGAFILTPTFGRGDAGNVVVKAQDLISLADQSVISSTVFEEGIGNGGDISIAAKSISLSNGAQLESSTAGMGRAGTIQVLATDAVKLSNSSLLVNSLSPTRVAGDIIVTSPQISLDNSATVEARSILGNGGNITIGSRNASPSIPSSNISPTETNLLLLRRGSQISTNALGTTSQGSDGGNININSKLIVAIPRENSDITANAVGGRGGNVNINSQGLFGIQLRPQLTDGSDITASSEFGQTGNININTPGIDPGKDTGELPTAPTDASNQISQACSTNQPDNKFFITGRGGHPPNTEDAFTSDVIWLDTRAAQARPEANNTKIASPSPTPAVGWKFDGHGKVTLLAASTEGETKRNKIVCPPNQTHPHGSR